MEEKSTIPKNQKQEGNLKHVNVLNPLPLTSRLPLASLFPHLFQNRFPIVFLSGQPQTNPSPIIKSNIIRPPPPQITNSPINISHQPFNHVESPPRRFNQISGSICSLPGTENNYYGNVPRVINSNPTSSSYGLGGLIQETIIPKFPIMNMVRKPSLEVFLKPCRLANSQFSDEFPINMSSKPYKYLLRLRKDINEFPNVYFSLSKSQTESKLQNFKKLKFSQLQFNDDNSEVFGVVNRFIRKKRVRRIAEKHLFDFIFEIQFQESSSKSKCMYRFNIKCLETHQSLFTSTPFLLYIRKSEKEVEFWNNRKIPLKEVKKRVKKDEKKIENQKKRKEEERKMKKRMRKRKRSEIEEEESVLITFENEEISENPNKKRKLD